MNENKFKPFPVLHMGRMVLRQLVDRDKKIIYRLRTDEEVSRFILRARLANKRQALDFIKRVNADIQNGRLIFWALCLDGEPDLIGTLCLWNFSENEKTAELGYEMFPAYQNRGLMTEAIKTVLNYGFSDCGLDNIEAYTNRENHRSKKLLDKFGFQLMRGKTDPGNPDNEIYLLRRTI